MRHARHAILLAGVLASLLAAPAGALAAGPVTVTGTVVRDGAPVVAVEVVVVVVGADVIVSTATDEQGAFAVEVDVAVGSELEVHATGRTERSDPDRRGCVTSETPVGTARAIVDTLPPAPVVVALDTVLTSTVCSATGAPQVTPPATDGPAAARPGTPSASGLLLALGLLALLAAALPAAARRSPR